MHIPQAGALTPLSISNLCAHYLQDQFRSKLHLQSISVATVSQLPPLMLPVPLISELDRIVLTLVDAFLNCGECISEISYRSYFK